MRKVIAAINMTIDGFCDHTAGIADDELHQHYNDLLKNAGALLYGRTTYQLMESYWPTLVRNPSGNKPEDDFAVLIDNIPKIVFSHTLKKVDWKNAKLATKNIEDEIQDLKQQPGKDIFVGSPSLIATCTKLNLLDEYQLCIHPVILGKGLPLFKDINDKSVLQLINTKSFQSGAIVLTYLPTKK
jgi:dihydrofolate reductase